MVVHPQSIRLLLEWRQPGSPPGKGHAMAEKQRRARSRPGWTRPRPTPILISPRTRTILLLAAVVALVLLVRAAPSVLVIVLGGITLALILSFPVRLLAHVMPRGLAILVTFLGLLGLVILAIVALVPLLVEQLTALVAATPQLAIDGNNLMLALLRPLRERDLLPGEPEEILAEVQQELFERAQTLAQALLAALLGFLSSALNVLLQVFGIFFVAIYLLIDARKFEAAYLAMAPRRYRRDARELWDAFGHSLSRYLGGLAFVVVIQGALATFALTVLDVPYAVVLGAWTSATAILPYIGAFLGAIPAVIIALFESPTKAILTALAYLAINQFEGNFLTPRIQGQALNVHPILVLLAVITGSEIAGLQGAIFAVPALAVLRVLVHFFRARLRVQESAPSTLLARPDSAPSAMPASTTMHYSASPPPVEVRHTGGDHDCRAIIHHGGAEGEGKQPEARLKGIHPAEPD